MDAILIGTKVPMTITADDGSAIPVGGVVCKNGDSSVVTVTPGDATLAPNSFWVTAIAVGNVSLLFSAPGYNPVTQSTPTGSAPVLASLVVTVGNPVPA